MACKMCIYMNPNIFGLLFRTQRNAGVRIRASKWMLAEVRYNSSFTSSMEDSKSLGLSTIVRREEVGKKIVRLLLFYCTKVAEIIDIIKTDRCCMSDIV